MKKVISCGGIIKVDDQILITKSTGNTNWNLPKGVMDINQTPIEAAIRQIREQTNIDVSNVQYTDLGQYNYLQYKNLHLFLFKLDEKPEDLFCASMFKADNNVYLPQISDYKWCTIKQSIPLFSKNVNKVLTKILKKYEL